MSLEKLLEKYADMKREFAPAMEMMKSVEKQIKDHVLETGEVISNEIGEIKVRKGYDRHSWDNKGLTGYAVSNPDIEVFKKTTTVKPSVTIKLH